MKVRVIVKNPWRGTYVAGVYYFEPARLTISDNWARHLIAEGLVELDT